MAYRLKKRNISNNDIKWLKDCDREISDIINNPQTPQPKFLAYKKFQSNLRSIIKQYQR